MAGPARKKTKKSFPTFDAELDETICDRYNNADLILTMKLGFRQVNPAGGAATGTHNDYGNPAKPARNIRKWSPGAWSLWKSNFIRTAQAFWHAKFWLINNHPCLEFEDGGVKYRHNVFCRFKLIGGDATGGSVHHHVIDVVRLAKTEDWFGSHATLYDSKDTEEVQKATDSAGNKIMQRAHVHEVGHLLGLGHEVEGTSRCPVSGDTNAAACYGASDEELNSVMGSGMQLRPVHAYPWRMAIADMTGKGAVRKPSENRSIAAMVNQLHALAGTGQTFTGTDFTSVDWQPKIVRHYPRTDAEVAANAAITVRPAR